MAGRASVPNRDADAAVEYDLLVQLSRAHLAEARATLRDWPGRPEVQAVAEADIGARELSVDGATLQKLRRGLQEVDPALRWWADAVLCERLLLELDRAGAELAGDVLTELPTEPLPCMITLYARARLRRAASARGLFDPSDRQGIEHSAGLRGDAIADLLRAGFVEEAFVTQALGAASEALMLGADLAGNYACVRDARTVLDDQRSAWLPYLDHLLVLVAAANDDTRSAAQAMARLRRVPHGSTLFGPLSQLVAAVGATLTPPDELSVTTLDEAVRGTDATMPRWRWAIQLLAAHRLALADHPEAERFAHAALAAPALGSGDEAVRQAHRLRFRIRSGYTPDPAEVTGLLDRLRSTGLSTVADWLADILADELKRAGREATSTSAVQQPVPSPQDTEGSHPLALREPAAEGNDRPPNVTVNVLCPALELTISGTRAVLGDHAALLLVHLVVAAPRPLHIEQLSQALWPGLRLAEARKRLNGHVYRLRRRHPAVADLVTRQGDMMAFSPTSNCEVDLATYRAATAHDGSDRLVALGRVRGNLCSAQFPYDERLVEARHRFAADWSGAVAEAFAGKPLPADVTEAAAALEVAVEVEQGPRLAGH